MTPSRVAPAAPASAPAHTFHPVAGAPDAPQDPVFLNTGVCHSTNPDGGCTLRAAVMEANAEAAYIAITLTAGTYSLTIPPLTTTDASTGNLDITDPQTVTFTGAGITHAFVDASGMGDRIFQLEGRAFARMTGFTVEHGIVAPGGNNTGGANGGGIDVSSPGAGLVLQTVRITSNTAAASGGGLEAEGSLWATNSQLDNNATGGLGGGFYSAGTASLVNDTVTGNTAAYRGGGVDISRGAVALQGGTVSGNHIVFPDGADAQGGGIFVGEATTIVGTTIDNNTIAPDSSATSGKARGGGLFVDYGLDRSDHVTIHGNTVSGLDPMAAGCSGDGGGGISDFEGFALTNSVVSGNRALDGNGGGICNEGNVEQLTHVTVSGNSAANDGGGIYGFDVTDITRSTVVSNSAGRYGGAFFGDDGQQIDQTLIANNQAVQGAGIWNEWQILLTNDTLAGNVASGTGNAGGAIYNRSNPSATLQLTNVTISGNRSDDGGGIAQLGGGVTVHNTIVANNKAVSAGTDTNCDVTVPLTDAGNNIDSGSTCALTGPGDRSNTNPDLGALASNGGATKTMALLSGSPAINAGSSPAPSVDQRGVKRGPRPDIGAFEVAGKG